MATYTLSGSGVQALSANVTALHITITTLPVNAGGGRANPTTHYDVGLLRFGDATGYFDAVPVVGGPQWLGVPAGTTRVGFACLYNAVISVDEVIGGTPPFGGVGSLASLSDVALASPADTQVLTYQASSGRWINAAASGGSGGSGTTTALLLDYDTSGQADNSSATVPTQTWTDIPGLGNQSFTVTNAAARLLVSVGGYFYVDTGSTVTPVSTRFVVDSAGTPIIRPLGGEIDGSSRSAPLSGAAPSVIGPLSAAAHTIKTQVWVQQSVTGTVRCFWNSQPNAYKAYMRVLQLG